MTVSDVLGRYGIELSEKDLVDLLEAVFEAESQPASTGLTGPEAEFLAAHSGVEADLADSSAAKVAVVERVRSELGGIARSVSTRQLAEQWGVDGSRVRHRAAEGTLYAMRVGRSLRFPTWQFDSDLRPLPGLALVLKALPEGLHPLEVEGWFTTPNGNLIVKGQPVSAREWLTGEGDPQAVVVVAADIDRW